MVETSRRFTPYHYGNNNPIRFIDPDGRQSWDNLNSYSRGSAVASFINRSGLGEKNLPMFYSDGAGMMIENKALGNDGQGGGGGNSVIDPSTKNTGPNLIQKIGNFFSNLFGGKKRSTATGHTVKATVISMTLIPEGAVVESSGAAIGTGLFSTVGLTAGAIFWPTMIKEPEFYWTRDLPKSIPITTTGDIPQQRMTLFRGVHGQHPDLANAYMGNAFPWGGLASAKQHNLGDNNSMYTSWSTSIDVANYSASRRGPGGIILRQSFPVSRLSFFDRHGEGEVQVFGPVFGAQKITPWNGGTWTPYIK